LIKITKNNWRAFIELHLMKNDNGTFVDSGDLLYFDITKRPVMIQQAEGGTAMILSDTCSVVVKEDMKDILKAVDKLIKEERERIAAENEAAVAAAMEKYKNDESTNN